MDAKRFFITGAGGQLAKAFCRRFDNVSLPYIGYTHTQLDISDEQKVIDAINKHQPRIVINCAAYNLVDKAEEEKDLADLINHKAVEQLAAICKSRNIFFIHFSTDYVFDGKQEVPYMEGDLTNPLNEYGRSKLRGEQAIARILEQFLVFRVSWVFGEGIANSLYKFSQWAKTKDTLEIDSETTSIPTYTEDIVTAVLSALEKKLTGVFHLTNSETASRYALAKYYFQARNEQKKILPKPANYFKAAAQRPRFSAMSNQLLSKKIEREISSWQNAVRRFLDSYQFD